MYDSLGITVLSLPFEATPNRNNSPQSLSQPEKDDTIGVNKFPQSAGREPVGILVGLGCRLELSLGVGLCIAQRSVRFGHHR